ncbi:MAG: HAD family hydrolase [Butyribacter sp.]|nr:HAD family hydrolase [bacterium]MDY3854020.1 HAD family hydrolase [Butyribacter sp.]
MKKLIFFDIDGTIITENEPKRIIPESLPKTLQLLKQNGHLCFINTGRAYAEIEEAIRNLPFDGYVCGCGTYISYHVDTLFSKTFPAEFGSQLIRDMNEHHLEWLLEGIENVYYSSSPYQTRIGNFKQEHKLLIPDAYHEVSPEDAKNLIFDKFCICLKPDSDFEGFYQKYKDTLTFIDRKHGFYEVTPQGCSKASGIHFLEEYFHIPHQDTIAIGDSTNDLPMLEYASYSIAMGNSAKELFPVVDYVTDTVINDGVYKAMQHLDLI